MYSGGCCAAACGAPRAEVRERPAAASAGAAAGDADSARAGWDGGETGVWRRPGSKARTIARAARPPTTASHTPGRIRLSSILRSYTREKLHARACGARTKDFARERRTQLKNETNSSTLARSVRHELIGASSSA